MSDVTLNRFIASGTTTQRVAFTPSPPTPASGPSQGYLWWDTTLQAMYAWDAGGAAWVAAGGGGGGASPGRVLIGVYTAAGAAAINCVSRTVGSGDLFQSDYDIYDVELVNIVPATAATFVRVRVSTDSGSTYDSGTNYNSNQIGWRAGGSALGGGGASQTQITLNLTAGNGVATTAARGGLSGSFQVFNPLSATVDKTFSGRVWDFEDTAAVYLATDFIGAYVSATPVTNFKVLMSSGNISGTVYVYGLAK